MYTGKFGNGPAYQAELKPDHTVDFKGHVSHSSEFRNMVFKLSKEGHDVVAVKNVYDRPHDGFPLEHATIYIVFDFDKIKNFKTW